jgi:hypothetical protein
MTTDAPIKKEIYIPEIPDEFSKPVESPSERPEEQPVKVPAAKIS